MLGHLHIKNLAVLSEASVEFEPGWNVLTGETGAGKSIVVDSLALLTGARASADLIRTDAETLTVTGTFVGADDTVRAALEEAGLDAGDGELVVRREISRSGRNRVFVNDQPATLRLLTDVMAGAAAHPWPARRAGAGAARAPTRLGGPPGRRAGPRACRRTWRVSTPSTAGSPSDSPAPTAASGCARSGSSWSRSRSPRSSGRRSARVRTRSCGASATCCATTKRSRARSADWSRPSSTTKDRRPNGSPPRRRVSSRSWSGRRTRRPGSRSSRRSGSAPKSSPAPCAAAPSASTPIPARLAKVEDRLAIVERLCRKYGPTGAERAGPARVSARGARRARLGRRRARRARSPGRPPPSSGTARRRSSFRSAGRAGRRRCRPGSAASSPTSRCPRRGSRSSSSGARARAAPSSSTAGRSSSASTASTR